MLNFFKSKISSFLGIDIGTNSIKLVELESVAGRPRLVTYGMVDVDSQVARADNIEASKQDQERVASAIKLLLQKSGARSRSVVAALPNFSVFSSLISLPKLGQKQMAEAILWEAKKFVPMPIENVVLDWKILNEVKQEEKSKDKIQEGMDQTGPISLEKPSYAEASEDKPSYAEASEDKPSYAEASEDKPAIIAKTEKNLAKCGEVISVLLTAAPRHLVERYVSIFKIAGLNLLSLETESFALSRSLVGNEEGVILIADVGSLTTDVTVVKSGVPIFSRSINTGGKTITQSIADSMGIDFERAEQFKRDSGITQAGERQAESSGVSKIIEQTFSSVINEMRYTLETQASQGKPVEKILLTGGSCLLKNLGQYISKSLGVKVFIANPWARVSYPRELEESLNQMATRIGVAAGLAMREIE